MSAQFEKDSLEPVWMGVVKTQVESLRFGTVQLVVHESRVVQIEKTEKVRLEGPGRTSSEGPKAALRANKY